MSFYLNGVEDGDKESKPVESGLKWHRLPQLVPTGAARGKPLAERVSKGTRKGQCQMGALAAWKTVRRGKKSRPSCS